MKTLDNIRYRLYLAFSKNKPIDMSSPTKMQMYHMLNTNVESLKNVEKISEDVQKEMIEKNPANIKYISSPTEKTQIAVMKVNSDYYHDIKNPCDMAHLTLVNSDPLSISHVKDPSENLQLYAINKMPSSIGYIKDPSERVQLCAVRKSPETLKLIDNPTEKVIGTAVEKDERLFANLKNPSEYIQMVAINKNPSNVLNINYPSPKVQLYALMRDIRLISQMDNSCLDAQIYALNHNVDIENIKNPADKTILMAANKQLGQPAFNINKVLNDKTRAMLFDIIIENPNGENIYDKMDNINKELKNAEIRTENEDIKEDPKEAAATVEKRSVENEGVASNGIGTDKYKLLENDTKEFEGKKLYRIQATKDFGNVKEGDLGGYIESTSNLSQKGNCWVYDNSIVKDQAKVLDDAVVKGGSRVKEQAYVVHKAVVENGSVIKGEAMVKNNAVASNVKIFDKVILENNANVHDDILVGNTKVSDANFENDRKIYGSERQQMEIVDDDHAVIYENGKSWPADDVMKGIKDNGSNVNDMSKEQLNKLAKGGQIDLPGVKGNTKFGLIKKAGGYGMQAFSMAKQINSALEQNV